MKVVLALSALVAIALAAPQQSDKEAVVLKNNFENIGTGDYNYAYETSNGISGQEAGQLVNVGTDQEGNSARGQFSYTGPDGVQYTITYVADENGFQPQGAHIPTAP